MRKLTDFKQFFKIEDVLGMKNLAFFIGNRRFIVPPDDDAEKIEFYTRIPADTVNEIAKHLTLWEKWKNGNNRGYKAFIEEENLADDFESFINYHFDFEVPLKACAILYYYEWHEIEKFLDMDSEGFARAKY